METESFPLAIFVVIFFNCSLIAQGCNNSLTYLYRKWRLTFSQYFKPHENRTTMMNEESSDWDSMSDPATQDQPSSLEELGQKDTKRSKNEITKASHHVGSEKEQERDLQRPSTGYQRALDSPNVTAQKQRIKEGIRNQSFDMSDVSKHQKDSFPKLEKKEYGTPIINKVCA